VKPETRLIVTFVVRLAFLFFAGYVALVPEATPGAPMLMRIALAATFLVVSILVGELSALRSHFGMLIRALRSAGGEFKGIGGVADEQAAVPILIRALESKDAATREKAHRNLVRITGQDLPPERAAWEAWWQRHETGDGEG
jgi:hypothetical protein